MGVLRGTRVAGLGEEEQGMKRRVRSWRKVEKEEGARDVGTGGLGESWGPQFPPWDIWRATCPLPRLSA